MFELWTDQSLEEEAKKAEAEREAAGDDDDHDNRKLKKPVRFRFDKHLFGLKDDLT